MTNTAFALSQPQPSRKLSTQMCAMLLIFSADAGLMAAVEPFVNLQNETVEWEQIRKISFCSGHRAAIVMAYGIWTDEVMEGSNPFDLALNMDAKLQRACLEALCMRWGLRG